MDRGKILGFVFVSLMLTAMQINAGEINLKSYTEQPVYYENDQIILIYEIENTSYEGIVNPSLEDFEIVKKQLQGPITSMVSINGNTTYTKSFKMYFLLKPKKTGVLRIPVAELYAEGKKYTAPAFNVEVRSLGDMEEVLDKGRVVKVNISNPYPYVGEAFTVKFELQTLDQIESAEQFNKGLEPVNYGTFHAKDITDHQGKQVRVSGKTVTIVELQKSVLFPVKEGVFKVPARTLEYTVPLYRQMGFMRVQTGNEIRTVTVPEVTIKVKALPNAPEDFSGLVGQYNLTAKSDKTKLQVNDALTQRYILEGTGNTFVFDGLELKWPEQWEVFDPTVNDQSKITSAGYKGAKVLEYVAIPRQNGEYKTPEVKLSYFNLKTKKYERLFAPSGTLLVEGEAGGNAVFGQGNVVKRKIEGNSQEEVRYISLDDGSSNLGWKGYFGSNSPLVFAGSIASAALLLFFFYRPKEQTIEEQLDRKRKLAFKTASKVLKEAEKELGKDGNAFYHQVELAFNAFLKDKLGLTNSDFNREELKDKLEAINLSKEEVEEVLTLQAKCGMARYSPIGVDQKTVFEEVRRIIEKLA